MRSAEQLASFKAFSPQETSPSEAYPSLKATLIPKNVRALEREMRSAEQLTSFEAFSIQEISPQRSISVSKSDPHSKRMFER